MKEIWKNIKDFPDYMISNLGQIKSLKFKKEKILEQSKNSSGYFSMCLSKNNKSETKQIHHLVYEIFNNYKLKDDECVHHDDKNKENNYYKNLIKMTLSEHSILHNSGENHPMFGKKCPEHSKRMSGKNNPNFGKNMSGKNNGMFGKHHSNEIRKKQSEKMKRRYKSGKLDYKGENNNNSKLIKENIIEIRKLCDENILTQEEIAKKFNIHRSTVSQIKNKKRWKNV